MPDAQPTPAGPDALRTALAAAVSLFPTNLHPNGPAVRSRFAPRGLILRWRNLADEAQPQVEPGRRDALLQAHTALAEQAGRDQATLTRVRAALASFDDRGVMGIGGSNLDIPTAGEVLTAVRTALDTQSTVVPGAADKESPDALTPCTCRQAVHELEHKNRTVPDCPWCTTAAGTEA